MISNWKVTGSMIELNAGVLVDVVNLTQILSHLGIRELQSCPHEVLRVVSSVMNCLD